MSENVHQSIQGIGPRLKSARLAASLTQAQLGDNSGTNQAVIQKIENNHSLQPRCIVAVAEAVNVNPAWLQFGDAYATREILQG